MPLAEGVAPLCWQLGNAGAEGGCVWVAGALVGGVLVLVLLDVPQLLKRGAISRNNARIRRSEVLRYDMVIFLSWLIVEALIRLVLLGMFLKRGYSLVYQRHMSKDEAYRASSLSHSQKNHIVALEVSMLAGCARN
jgi:hypothetical protein